MDLSIGTERERERERERDLSGPESVLYLCLKKTRVNLKNLNTCCVDCRDCRVVGGKVKMISRS